MRLHLALPPAFAAWLIGIGVALAGLQALAQPPQNVTAGASSTASANASVDPQASPQANAPATAPVTAASAAGPTHRPLRAPLPTMDALPAPTVPEVFTGYPGAPPYTVVPRKPELPLFPCSMCHNQQKLNTTVRTFVVAPPPEGAPHAGVLRHGKGRFWCLDCHLAKDREWLHTTSGAKIDFDDSPQLCGQCHSARYRDWVFGAHGKRVAGWTGERQLYACTHCHDPHSPGLLPRAPSKPPPLRAGLSPMPPHAEPVLPAWQRHDPSPAHDTHPEFTKP